MFYWSRGDVHVVLNDDEELSLVRELADGKPADCVDYHTSRKTRHYYEQRIFRYFEQLLSDNPESFQRKYVFRSCYGEDAQKMFPVLLDAYGRVTKRATFGEHAELSPLDEAPERILYHATGELYYVTLFGRGRWPWSPRVVTGRICFPAHSIEKLAGSVDNFFVATDSFHIKFHRDYVLISVLDRQAA
jgi:hypothetical protein